MRGDGSIEQALIEGALRDAVGPFGKLSPYAVPNFNFRFDGPLAITLGDQPSAERG